MPSPNEDLAIGTALTVGGIAFAPATMGLSIIPGIIYGALREKHAQDAAGEATMAWARRERDIAEFNAAIAGVRAEDALARGAWQADQIRIGSQLLIGEQRAGFAAQNVDVGIGSPVDVNADTAYLAELDAQMALMNAKREAWGYKVDAFNYRQAGQQALLAGEAGQMSARYQGNSAVLGAAADISLLAQRYGWGSKIKGLFGSGKGGGTGGSFAGGSPLMSGSAGLVLTSPSGR